MSKERKAALAHKRERLAAKITEIAPHIDSLIGLLEETKVDIMLIALGVGSVEVRDE